MTQEQKQESPINTENTSHHLFGDVEEDKRNIVKSNIYKEICKGVIRNKLMKLRHLIIQNGIQHDYLQHILFPIIQKHYVPHIVQYNGGIANIQQWTISCYLEVMENGIPTTEPNLILLQYCTPLLNQCNDLFLYWYQQQHPITDKKQQRSCRRLMTFITRYTSAPKEQSLLKHIDGAGKVDGSMVIALPIEEPYETNYFIGGGLTFWDGPKKEMTTTTTIGNNESLAESTTTQQDQISDVENRNKNITNNNICNSTIMSNPESNNNDCCTTSNSSSSNALTTSEHNHTNHTITKTTTTNIMSNEIHYDTRSGDIAFIDRAVWHQADPITRGTRWALVIFYKVLVGEENEVI